MTYIEMNEKKLLDPLPLPSKRFPTLYAGNRSQGISKKSSSSYISNTLTSIKDLKPHLLTVLPDGRQDRDQKSNDTDDTQ